MGGHLFGAGDPRAAARRKRLQKDAARRRLAEQATPDPKKGGKK